MELVLTGNAFKAAERKRRGLIFKIKQWWNR